MARYKLSLIEAKRLTLSDYHNYSLAYEIAQNDKHRDIALQAWQNQTVQATTGKGKNRRSKYKKFEDFYPYQKNFEIIIKGEDNENKAMTLADKNKQLRNLGKGGT